MTASDPRVGEIQARLDAATQGPIEYIEYPRRGGRIHTETPKRQLIADLYGSGNPQFYAHARDDVAYLLAELADRDEKLAAVAVLAEAWRYKGEFGWGAWQEGHGPDQEGYILDITGHWHAAM